MSDTKMNWEQEKETLLEGLNGTRKEIVSTLLENQRKEVLKHPATAFAGQRTLNEAAASDATGVSALSTYDHLVMPLVRRVIPSLLAIDLVGVQPMKMPVGMIRTLRHFYADSVSPGSSGVTVTAGTEADGANLYENYSEIVQGAAYDSASSNPLTQTEALESASANELNLTTVKQTIEAKSRKLNAVWSLEADEDAKALDGIDLEQDMVAELSSEIQHELDRELLDNLISLSGTANSFDFSQADGRYAGERFTALAISLSALSAGIALKTKLGGATWAVVSNDILTALRNANSNAFQAVKAGDLVTSQSLFAGTLNGTIKVYLDNYASLVTSSPYCLMGYKGSEQGVGFVYAPYIPLVSSGVVIDPSTHDSHLQLRTRYAMATFTDTATSLGNSADYYARTNVSNLSLGIV